MSSVGDVLRNINVESLGLSKWDPGGVTDFAGWEDREIPDAFRGSPHLTLIILSQVVDTISYLQF